MDPMGINKNIRNQSAAPSGPKISQKSLDFDMCNTYDSYDVFVSSKMGLKDNHTVDGRNRAPVDMVNIPSLIGFHTSQVVQDFFHQQYEIKWNDETIKLYLLMNTYLCSFHHVFLKAKLLLLQDLVIWWKEAGKMVVHPPKNLFRFHLLPLLPLLAPKKRCR